MVLKKERKMPVKRFLAPFCILALAVIACGVTVDLGTSPSGTSAHQLTGVDQVSTMVEQTLQALTQEALSATPANTPTPDGTATPVNTPLPPTLSVSLATNCYAGPSTHYGFVITIYPGTTVAVVGKDTADNYWVIDVPGYPGTVCWLSGQYANLSGDTADLSAPATTMILYALSAPDHLRISCNRPTQPRPAWTPFPTPGAGTPWPHHPGNGWQGGNGWHGSGGSVVFSWRNTDPDQTGLRVYRDGYRVATLGGGATSYSDGWHGGGGTYGVQAFNSTEISSIETISTGNCR